MEEMYWLSQWANNKSCQLCEESAVETPQIRRTVEQRKRMFFKWLVLCKGGVDDIGHEPADSSDSAVSVAMAHWNVEHRVFAVAQFF